jgi:peptidoglycan/xylan/chitin deacetylase (PgdA/CDA1 family)
MPDQTEKMGLLERFEQNLTAAIPLGVYQRTVRRLVIGLVYHTITPEPLDHLRFIYPAKTPAMFEADLVYLKENFLVISYPDYLAMARGEVPGAPNTVLITFDDGYRECRTTIGPLLEKYRLPGIFFVTTDFLDNRVLFYRNKYSLCVARIQATSPEEIAALLPIINAQFGQDLHDSHTLQRWLRSLNFAQESILDEICALLDVDVERYLQNQQPYMTSEDVRRLAAAGHTIGAHSRRHPKLNSLSEDAQAEEILESCRAVQGLTGQDQVPFAFPFSGYGVRRPFLARLQNQHREVGIFFDSKGVRLDKRAILNRIWADPPANPEVAGSNLNFLIHAAYQENARWRPRYLANTLAARLRRTR